MHHSLPLPRSYRDDTHNGSGGGLVEQPKEGETAPKLSVPAGAQTVNGAVAAQALRDLRQHLSSEVERLFLHDGTVNSGAPELLLRAVTDDAATAVLLRYATRIIHPSPIPSLARSHVPNMSMKRYYIFVGADRPGHNSATRSCRRTSDTHWTSRPISRRS